MKTIKIIKVDMEQKEKVDVEKMCITMLIALGLSLTVQWSFAECMSCTKRNNQPKEEARIKMLKVTGKESSDEFKLISHEKSTKSHKNPLQKKKQ